MEASEVEETKKKCEASQAVVHVLSKSQEMADASQEMVDASQPKPAVAGEAKAYALAKANAAVAGTMLDESQPADEAGLINISLWR